MLCVEGAAVANGLFAPDGEVNGKPRWRHVSEQFWIGYGGDGRWHIVNNPGIQGLEGGTNDSYYVCGSPDLLCERHLWVVDQHGKQPGPKISQCRALYVEGAGVAAVNGWFTPNGELHGKPRWQHASAHIWLRRGSDGRWCLVNNPDGNALPGSRKLYYYATSSSDFCCERHLWLVDEHGQEPRPKISEYVGEVKTQSSSIVPMSSSIVPMVSSIPWPLRKLRQGMADYSPSPGGPAVILTTGGMNPVHLGHVQLLHQAKFRLERAGYRVVGMWLSPSHDGYLQLKATSLGTIGLSAAFRLAVAGQAVADDALVAVGAWEAQKPGRWPDFPEVTHALAQHLAELHSAGELGCIESPPSVFYACGTDHAAKCGLYNGMGAGLGVVVIPRSGETADMERPERLVFVAEPTAGEIASFSSTKVRTAIVERNHDYLTRSMPSKAAQFLLQPQAEVFSAYQSDFAKLGVVMRRRQIYISLSGIFRMWDKKGEALLSEIPDDALFFFGSKRSWVFPGSEAERIESHRENPKYTSPVYEKIRTLILEKETASQVFFLKPPGFIYNGDLFHGDPAAFPKASEWLTRHVDPTTGKHYAPLLLDPHWWQTVFNPAGARYTKHATRIVKNFQCGAHDYNPIMELLYQSNSSLEIKL